VRTLTSNTNSNKNLQGEAPTLVLDIVSKSFYVTTKDWTMNLEVGGTRVYSGDIARRSGSALSYGIPITLDSISSLPVMSIGITDFQGNIRANLLGSTPDLTGTTASVYIKYDSDSELNRSLIFQGIVDRYSIKGDLFTIRLKSAGYPVEHIGTLLSDSFSNVDNSENIIEPLQYGDFNWADDPEWWGDRDDVWAICPLIHIDAGQQTYMVANHKMNQFPTTQAEVRDSRDSYLFSRRGNHLVHHEVWDITTVNVTDCSFKLEAQDPIMSSRVYIWAGDEFAGEFTNDGGDHANAIDGKVGTNMIMSPTDTTMHSFHDFIFSDDIRFNESDNVNNIHAGYSSTISVHVYVSSVEGTGDLVKVSIKKKSDDSVLASAMITDAMTTAQWYNIVSFGSSFDISTLNDYYIEFDEQAGNNIETDISGFMIRIPVARHDLEIDEKCLYARCQGRQYSGTWGARRTSAALITKSLDILESILRDEVVHSIDTTTFDAVDALDTFDPAFTLFERELLQDFLRDFAKTFNIGIMLHSTGDVGVVKGVNTIDFTKAGSDTAGDDDIFTDVATITANEFDENPILDNTFVPDRSDAGAIVEQVDIVFNRTFSGNFLESGSSGSGVITALQNRYMNKLSHITNLAADIITLRGQQLWIVRFTTFNNALWVEPGDVINIRHSVLNDTILPSTENAQKWVVIGWSWLWKAGTVGITAIALP